MMFSRSRPALRSVLLAVFGAALLSACSPSSTSDTPVTPVEITRETSSVIDGMLLADYPGPKAQIHYAGQARPDFVCNTADMFYIHLAPEQVRKLNGIFVQDMAKADWDDPRGHWIDARTAWYVAGSSRRGSMGPTLASFAEKGAAEAFAKEYGGQVLHYSEVTLDIVTPPDDGLSGHRH
ncbi:MAG: nitrous oxide reductase accessory protein NosL [Rhodocyclaceae bacterium]|jgi:copper chaperone NosL|nr:nitrous oxide reductase accessory protein NosL [Rhodocyclaceae bacterium]